MPPRTPPRWIHSVSDIGPGDWDWGFALARTVRTAPRYFPAVSDKAIMSRARCRVEHVREAGPEGREPSRRSCCGDGVFIRQNAIACAAARQKRQDRFSRRRCRRTACARRESASAKTPPVAFPDDVPIREGTFLLMPAACCGVVGWQGRGEGLKYRPHCAAGLPQAPQSSCTIFTRVPFSRQENAPASVGAASPPMRASHGRFVQTVPLLPCRLRHLRACLLGRRRSRTGLLSRATTGGSPLSMSQASCGGAVGM